MSNDYRIKTALPSRWRAEQARIEGYARAEGLDFFPVVYEMVSHEQMSELAAKNGFPEKFPHWSYGMAYDKLSKTHSYGLSLIMEMVINSNPSYAYLQETNSDVITKTVISHVCGHSAVFKHNYTFRATDLDGGDTINPTVKSSDYNPKRGWIDIMANNGAKIRRIIDTVGLERVEELIDCCMSLENLIDVHAPFMGKRKVNTTEENNKPVKVPKIKSDKSYMENFLNPEEYIQEQKKKLEDEKTKARKFPEYSERDVLGFLLNHAPLETWERTVVEVLYQEAFYFSPQRQTKILNEGVASFFESVLMTQKVCNPNEIIEYAESHSAVLATNGKNLNPYKLGIELLRHIETRWNKGQFGRDWEECDDMAAKTNWDTKASLGRQKIFEVIKNYNDATFIDEFLDETFVQEQKLFNIDWSDRNQRYEISSREFKKVKEKLLFQLTNGGDPFIYVDDANHDNRGELLLKHEHQGMDLRQDYAKAVLKAMNRIWKRPICLNTIVEEKSVMIRFDGTEHTSRQLRG